ncbi:MAG TPA: bacteriohemerythrin [Azonexus sp.]
MSFMPWTDALALGIESIDQQHRWLVDATNRLHAEITQPEPQRAVLGEILEGLVDYTMNHFVLEEELFQRLGYAETPAHKAEHDAFTATAMDLLLKFEDGASVGAPVLDFLKEWLQHHILKVDRAYAPFLIAAGVR